MEKDSLQLAQLSEKDHVSILGSGPCGLGVAAELQKAGFPAWSLFESASKDGGLARTVDSKGFSFDLGGHVTRSHYQEFNEMCDLHCKDWLEHRRSVFAYMRQKLVPYPLQYNFGHLPPEEVEMCLEGLRKVVNAPQSPENIQANFAQWLQEQFGDGLYKVFLEPYNFKVWAHPLEQMTAAWVKERVPTFTPEILQSIANGEPHIPWKKGETFRYPKYGGAGSLWVGVAAELDQDNLHHNKTVISIDATEKIVTFQDGTRQTYDFLVSTIPLDKLCQMVTNLGSSHLKNIGRLFHHSSTHVIGVGLQGETPEHLIGKSWIYFPEENIPFHRATVLSNYSPYVVPEPGKQWSLLLEMSESAHKPLSPQLLQQSLSACYDTGLIPKGMNVVNVMNKRLEYGYPTPFLGRDEAIRLAMTFLEKHQIYSRGRFGGWKYEVSNQDHTYMQGVEVARKMLTGKNEETFTY